MLNIFAADTICAQWSAERWVYRYYFNAIVFKWNP